MIVNIKLTTAGTDTGPTFNIFSNFDNYTTPVASGVFKSSLVSQMGQDVTVDNAATIMRVTSIGTCTNYVDLPVVPQYQLQIGNNFGTVGAACGNTPTQLGYIPYAGNLQVGTIISGMLVGSPGFSKITASTQPGFTYTGYILGYAPTGTGDTVVQSITAC